MSIHKLKAIKLNSLPPGKHEDGGGLRFVVSSSSAKKWVLRYTFHGRRREMGLGSFPDIGLAEARERAREYRNQVQNGTDPINNRKKNPVNIPTFTSCSARYIRAHRRGWKNRKHAHQWLNTIRTYAKPVIGNKTIDAVTTEDILKILSPIWTSKTETAKRLQGRIENILDYAAAHKLRDPLNPARWHGHLDKLLPRPSKVKTVTHFPAMPYADLPYFMAELPINGLISASALKLLILTATRTSEVLLATWDEVSLDNGIWHIPAERMKAGREHQVPLSDYASTLIRTLPREEGNNYLFPGGRRGRPLSNMSLLTLMRRLGFGPNCTRGNYVPHGFRSSFRDWAAEETSFPREVAEMALAHTIESKTEAAYRRLDLLNKRRDMMQVWADYLRSEMI